VRSALAGGAEASDMSCTAAVVIVVVAGGCWMLSWFARCCSHWCPGSRSFASLGLSRCCRRHLM